MYLGWHYSSKRDAKGWHVLEHGNNWRKGRVVSRHRTADAAYREAQRLDTVYENARRDTARYVAA